jgi:hypothetical protein
MPTATPDHAALLPTLSQGRSTRFTLGTTLFLIHAACAASPGAPQTSQPTTPADAGVSCPEQLEEDQALASSECRRVGSSGMSPVGVPIESLLADPAKYAGMLVSTRGYAVCGPRVCESTRCTNLPCCGNCGATLGLMAGAPDAGACARTDAPPAALVIADPWLPSKFHCTGDRCKLDCTPLTPGSAYQVVGLLARFSSYTLIPESYELALEQ